MSSVGHQGPQLMMQDCYSATVWMHQDTHPVPRRRESTGVRVGGVLYATDTYTVASL